eukprot:UN0953
MSASRKISLLRLLELSSFVTRRPVSNWLLGDIIPEPSPVDVRMPDDRLAPKVHGGYALLGLIGFAKDGLARDSVLGVAVLTRRIPPVVSPRNFGGQDPCHEVEAALHVRPTSWLATLVLPEVMAERVATILRRAVRVLGVAPPRAAAKHVRAMGREVAHGLQEHLNVHIGVHVHLANVRNAVLTCWVVCVRCKPEPCPCLFE